MSQAHRMEVEYLKKCFGTLLAQGLAEVAKVRPSDPIEYLAHWLHHNKKILEVQEEVCAPWISLRSFPRVT